MLRNSAGLFARPTLRTIANRNAVTLSGVGVPIASQANRSRPLSGAPNNYEEKYAAKLQEKARVEGYASVQAMMDAYKERLQKEEARILKVQMEADAKRKEALAAGIANDKLPPHVKPLRKIVVLENFEKETSETIEKLWVGYHANKDAISAVIPRETYLTLHERAKACPSFVLPVFREDATADTYLLQHSGHQTFFTSLLSYQTLGAEAPILTTLTYYTDLMESKGIVLLYGEVDLDKMPIQVAKRLTQGMRNFYVDEEYALVEQMHNDPKDFEFTNVLKVVRARMGAKEAANVVVSSSNATAESAE